MKVAKIMDRLDVLNSRIISLEKSIAHLGSDRDYIDEKRTLQTIHDEYVTEKTNLSNALDTVDVDVTVPVTIPSDNITQP